MEKYNYSDEMFNDVKTWLADNLDECVNAVKDEEMNDLSDFESWLNDRLFCEDSVTGNGSGSYTFSTWQAEENLCHNLDLLGDALEEFGCDASYMTEKGAEACDVTIRCYLLGEVISTVFEGCKNISTTDELIKAITEAAE